MYLEFYISVDGTPVNATDVVETFKVPHVNLLNTDLEVEVSNDHVQIIAVGSTFSLPLPLLISLTPEKVKQFRFPYFKNKIIVFFSSLFSISSR